MIRTSLIIVLLLSCSACLNLGTVEEGRLYRSAQPDAEDIEEVTKRYKIRSILNLRGAKAHKDWYQEELASSKKLGLVRHDVRWSATRMPRPHELLRVLEAFEKGPYPMLVHCRAGADRTGLASSVYMLLKGADFDTADAQLTFKYWHVPVGPTTALDDFLELYRDTAKGKPFAQWAREDYPAIYKTLDED